MKPEKQPKTSPTQYSSQVAKSRYSRELNLNIDIQEKINNAVANENPEETVDDVPEETLVEVDGATEAGVEIADEEQVEKCFNYI